MRNTEWLSCARERSSFASLGLSAKGLSSTEKEHANESDLLARIQSVFCVILAWRIGVRMALEQRSVVKAVRETSSSRDNREAIDVLGVIEQSPLYCTSPSPVIVLSLVARREYHSLQEVCDRSDCTKTTIILLI